MTGELEWCRAFIDHHCVFRSPPDRPLLTTKGGSGANVYQFYLPVAVLNARFAQKAAALFWQSFAVEFHRQRFQIAGCESGGIPLACALQAEAYRQGRPVNVFAVKKAQKAYGLKNWLEGMVVPGLPVLLVDDVVGARTTLTTAARRLAELGLEVTAAFAVAAVKLNRPLSFKIGTREVPITVLFQADDFAHTHGAYVRKYGKVPQFHGTVI